MANKVRIKEICKEKGMTLEQLAGKLGILRTSLAQAMSRNNFSVEKLNEIADALSVPVWQLFVSPEEVAASSSSASTLVCPHCGKPLHIKVE